MKKHAKSYGGHRARAMGFDSASIFDADEKTQPASQVSLSNQVKPPLGRKLQYTETSALNELLFNEIGVGDSYQCISNQLDKKTVPSLTLNPLNSEDALDVLLSANNTKPKVKIAWSESVPEKKQQPSTVTSTQSDNGRRLFSGESTGQSRQPRLSLQHPDTLCDKDSVLGPPKKVSNLRTHFQGTGIAVLSTTSTYDQYFISRMANTRIKNSTQFDVDPERFFMPLCINVENPDEDFSVLGMESPRGT